jgi:hypothetical protein
VKALELDRVRAFNENILESLDDGCWSSTERPIVRGIGDRALYGVSRSRATGRRSTRSFDAPFVEAMRAGADRPSARTCPHALRRAGRDGDADVNVAVVPLRARRCGVPRSAPSSSSEDVTERACGSRSSCISREDGVDRLLAAAWRTRSTRR